MCRFSVNNLSEFVSHPYASHVLRTALQCLAGIRMSEDALRSRRYRTQQGTGGNRPQNKKLNALRSEIDPDEESVSVLENAAKRTCELMEEDAEALSSDAASGVVQVLMACLAKAAPKQFRKVAKILVSRLVGGDDDDGGVQAIMECEASARLIESVISHCGDFPKLLSNLSKQLFEGRLIKWSQHPVGNFTVQRLIDACSDKEKVSGH